MKPIQFQKLVRDIAAHSYMISVDGQYHADLSDVLCRLGNLMDPPIAFRQDNDGFRWTYGVPTTLDQEIEITEAQLAYSEYTLDLLESREAALVKQIAEIESKTTAVKPK